MSTTSSSSESISLLRLASTNWLEHLTLLGLKTTLTTVSAASPAPAIVSSLPSKRSPTTISTLVVLEVNSSQSCSSFICCFSSLPVSSGVTSKQEWSPFTCSAEILKAMANVQWSNGVTPSQAAVQRKLMSMFFKLVCSSCLHI